jgi:hypothetical protein
MSEPASCCVLPGGYCGRVDTLFNDELLAKNPCKAGSARWTRCPCSCRRKF